MQARSWASWYPRGRGCYLSNGDGELLLDLLVGSAIKAKVENVGSLALLSKRI